MDPRARHSAFVLRPRFLSLTAVDTLTPFELLVLSYVVLGTVHYTTEISWLQDRKHVLRDGSVALIWW
jgi:hypothetical protein